MIEIIERNDVGAKTLTSLGLSRADARRLLRSGASYDEARHLIRELGCPPSLVADILLWAAEVESGRS